MSAGSKSSLRPLSVEELRRRKLLRTRRQFVTVAVFPSVLSLLTANPLLSIAAVLSLLLILLILFEPGTPPVLAFAATFQWAQVAVPVAVANSRGLQLDEVVLSAGGTRIIERLPELQTAAWLGLATVFVLSVGMRLGQEGLQRPSTEELNRAAETLQPRALLSAYLLSFVVGVLVTAAISIVPSLRQQILPLAAIRAVVVFVSFWGATRAPSLRPLAFGMLIVETLLGFTGYFSDFKSVFFIAAIVGVGAQLDLRKLIRPVTILGFAAVVLLASFWQAVKRDYRVFVSGGEKAQIVVVPIAARFDYLLHEASRLTISDLEDGFVSGLERLGYLEFFARAIQTVPALVAFQDGRLWKEALKHIVTPRVFFPNKPVVDDSARTNEFTGVLVSGADVGTSISMGYAAESYIDFGAIFMFVPILLLGMFWGWSYAKLVRVTRNKLLGIAFAVTYILANTIYFESSNIKLFGGGVTALAVYWFVLRFRRGEFAWRFISQGRL